LENNEWVSFVSMNSVSGYAGAAQLQDGTLLVTGGWNGQESLNITEIFTEAGWESNIPSLPVTIYAHCIVSVNSTTVMVIGGNQNDKTEGKTFYFTFGELRWREGPALKYKRSYHSCGKIRRDKESQEMSIIVAGGLFESSFLSSVEILDEGSNEWQTGHELPVGIAYSQMVEDPNGGVVLIGGQSELDTLYQLPHGGQNAGWTKIEQKLKTERWLHTAFLVPDNIVDCS
jgi:N-acetylneuraminic acid mutarotase